MPNVTAAFRFFLLQVPGAGTRFFPEVPHHDFRPVPFETQAGGWWIPAALFLSFTFLVIIRVFDNRRLIQYLNGFFRSSSVGTLYREEYALSSRFSVLLLTNYLLMMSLFTWQAARYYHINADGLTGFGLIAGALFAAYCVKIISIRMLGNIFEVKDAAMEYSFNVLLFNKTIGLVLFPFTLLLAYARQIEPGFLVITGLVCLAIILLYRFLRVFLIGMATPSISFVYIILYLCTLELIPFVVIIKVFVGKF